MTASTAQDTADLTVARQPIFDGQQRVVAYELLFRSGAERYLNPSQHPSQATSRIISSGTAIGLRTLTAGKPAFVNFGRDALVGDLYLALPPKNVVVEVLETVEPDDQVIAACRKLKDGGYRLALDDYVDRPDYAPLVELADFVKVDILTTPLWLCGTLSRRLQRDGRALLAEKVETPATFRRTLRQGYQLFQGYFFAQPVIVRSKVVTGYRLNYLRLLEELHGENVSISRLEEIVKRDVSLSLRFLQRVNSAAFGFSQATTDIRHALVLLGEREIRACATVWALAELGRDSPSEVIVSSALRGRLCELLAETAGGGCRPSELFLLGVFSLLDVILEQPMSTIAAELPVSGEIREALQGKANRLSPFLTCVKAYEQGRWSDVHAAAVAFGIDESLIPDLYLKTVEWTNTVFKTA